MTTTHGTGKWAGWTIQVNDEGELLSVRFPPLPQKQQKEPHFIVPDRGTQRRMGEFVRRSA